MVSIVLKANIFSIIYLIFILRYVTSRAKTHLLVRMAMYVSVCLACQYFLFMLNLTDHTSPAPFPAQLAGYPSHKGAPANLSRTSKASNTTSSVPAIKYAIPVFFQHQVFHDLKLGYLIGIGIEQDQVQNLILDFINLYLVSMYVYHYRNPILVKSMQKVFWVFPTPADAQERWRRLNSDVKRQVKWLISPIRYSASNPSSNPPVSNPKYDFGEEEEAVDADLAERQYEFAKQYERRNNPDLNDLLITYVDLKYDSIWSEDFCKAKKWEFKEQSLYFRLVKQGSVLVYLTFHVVTCLVVLLMGVLRQSFLSLGYVLILLPRMKDGSEVLRQRLLHQGESKNLKEQAVKRLEAEIAEFEQRKGQGAQADDGAEGKQDEEPDPELELMKEDLAARRAELANMKKENSSKSFEQKQDERVDASEKQWKMIKVVEVYLMAYACLDFVCQIIAQLPIIGNHSAGQSAAAKADNPQQPNLMTIIGFRKIWRNNHDTAFDYNVLINSHWSKAAGEAGYHGLQLHWDSLMLQTLNCVMICAISL